MPLPPSLRDNFASGRENLSETTALLNKFAKWLQSPNIPRMSKAPIMMEEMESIIEKDPELEDWLFKLQSEQSKQELPVPKFFPEFYKTPEYYTNIYKCPDRYIYALLSAHDSCFPLYSNACKKDAVSKMKTHVLSKFYDIYNAPTFRLYKKTKSELYNAISNNPGIPELHMISETLNVNIIVLRQFNYEWASVYNPERITYCLWESDVDVGAIRHVTLGGKLKIESILKDKIDIDEDRTLSLHINSNKKSMEAMKGIKLMNMNDLKEYCKSNDMHVFDGDGVPYKKNELLNRIRWRLKRNLL